MNAKKFYRIYRKQFLLPFFVLFLLTAAFFPIQMAADQAGILVTIATFLFAIFAGFFISRQGTRYSKLRDTIATFDGNISAIYRSADAFGKQTQQAIAETIRAHYQAILSSGQWDYHLTRKSNTITTLNHIIAQATSNAQLSTFQQEVLNNLLASLDALQIQRKHMVSLHRERMSHNEWLLMLALIALLLAALLFIPTVTFFGVLLKSFFAVLVAHIGMVLYELDTLQLFEHTMGASSAKDILNIIDGKR